MTSENNALLNQPHHARQFIDDLVQYMAANDEWIGWTIWAAGPIWGTNSPCCGPDTGSLEPGDLNDLGEPKYVANTVLGQ